MKDLENYLDVGLNELMKRCESMGVEEWIVVLNKVREKGRFCVEISTKNTKSGFDNLKYEYDRAKFVAMNIAPLFYEKLRNVCSNEDYEKVVKQII